MTDDIERLREAQAYNANLRQPDLLVASGIVPKVPVYTPDVEDVRAKLHRALEKFADGKSIDRDDFLLWRTIFPQMCNWLPAEEADDLRRRFAERLIKLSPMGA